MARRHTADTWWWVLVVLLVLWPVMMIFMMPGGSAFIGPSWFWLVLLVSFWLLLGIGGRGPVPVTEETGPRMLHEPEQPAVVREVMRVDVATEQPEGTRIFRGRLNQPAESAYARLRTTLGGDTIPLLQQDDTAPAAIVLMPKSVERTAVTRPVRPWLHWLMFALTIATTTWAGGARQGVDVMREPARILAGLPYSLGLMAILGVHELGHCFARRQDTRRARQRKTGGNRLRALCVRVRATRPGTRTIARAVRHDRFPRLDGRRVVGGHEVCDASLPRHRPPGGGRRKDMAGKDGDVL